MQSTMECCTPCDCLARQPASFRFKAGTMRTPFRGRIVERAAASTSAARRYATWNQPPGAVPFSPWQMTCGMPPSAGTSISSRAAWIGSRLPFASCTARGRPRPWLPRPAIFSRTTEKAAVSKRDRRPKRRQHKARRGWDYSAGVSSI